MKKQTLILLISIILLGAALRFVGLGAVPVGFHRDEAFQAYNAWSILKTGRDMTGDLLPVHIRSYLYSPAGYSYAAIPFLAIFGLTPFASRAPSAFFGTITLLVLFFLVRELFRDKSYRTFVALTSALVLSISPWHINLSRTLTENTLVVFFITLAVWIYLVWLRSNKTILLAVSYISFAATLLIYQAARAFLPLFIPILLFLNKHIRRGLPMQIGLYIAIILIPIMLILASPALSTRLSAVSIFHTDETKLVTQEQYTEDGVSYVLPPITRALHNKFLGFGRVFINNYFAHFSFPFLFGDEGFPLRYKVPGATLLYLIELPLLTFGIWKILKNDRKIGLFLLTWILLAPVGSALTYDDVPNLQRTLIMQPSLSILIAYGIYSIKAIGRYIPMIAILVTGIYLFQAGAYLEAYYVHQVIHHPYYRNEGYGELVSEISSRLSEYPHAVITNREAAPTIFFLFFTAYDPAKFQIETKGSPMHDFDRIAFGSYEFSTEECPVREITTDQNGRILPKPILTGTKGILYVNYYTCKTPSGATELKEIKRSDNTGVFKIVTIN